VHLGPDGGVGDGERGAVEEVDDAGEEEQARLIYKRGKCFRGKASASLSPVGVIAQPGPPAYKSYSADIDSVVRRTGPDSHRAALIPGEKRCQTQVKAHSSGEGEEHVQDV
jgi:hypothetical protein